MPVVLVIDEENTQALYDLKGKAHIVVLSDDPDEGVVLHSEVPGTGWELEDQIGLGPKAPAGYEARETVANLEFGDAAAPTPKAPASPDSDGILRRIFIRNLARRSGHDEGTVRQAVAEVEGSSGRPFLDWLFNGGLAQLLQLVLTILPLFVNQPLPAPAPAGK